MHKQLVLVLGLLQLQLIIAQQCPDLISQFCSTQSNCPAGNSLSIQAFSLPFSQYNAICFGNLESQGGDIQGRVMIQGNMNVPRGLSIGNLLAGDVGIPYSLIVGGNALWGSGSLSPDAEGMYVGGTFTGAPELSLRQRGGPCATAGCLENEFMRAKNYFSTISNLMSNLEANVMLDTFGNLMCNQSEQLLNVLEIDDARKLDQIQRGSQVYGCNLEAILIINIKGNFEVNLTGSGIWQIPNIIYNVIGTRILRVQTQVNGLILAPNSQLNQTGGVIVGNVISGQCTALQFNLACIPAFGGGNVPNTGEGSQAGSQSGSGSESVPTPETRGGVLSGSQSESERGVPGTQTPQIPVRETVQDTQLGTQSESQSEAQRETQAETQRETQAGTQRETQATQSGGVQGTQQEAQRETQAGTQRETQRETQGGTQRETQAGTQRETQRETQQGTQRETQQGTQRETQAGTQRGTQAAGTQRVTELVPPIPTQITGVQITGVQLTGTQGGLTGTTPPANISSSCAIPLWESGFQCQGFNFVLNNSSLSFQNFDVIVFGNLTGNTGDIQGSAIVENAVTLGRGFSIGDKLQAGTQYALVVGGNLLWESGALLPSLSTFYAGGSQTIVPLEILSNRLGSSCTSERCLSQFFASAKECYSQISSEISRLTSNVQVSVENFRALITCNSASESSYIVNIAAPDISRVLWYEFENCNQQATWVVNVLGNEDILFQGGSFPARPNSLVFNIIGSGRTLTVQNAVLGSILAPNSNVVQPGGVIAGKVIAQSLQVLQVSKIDCETDGQLRDGSDLKENNAMVALPSFFVSLISMCFF